MKILLVEDDFIVRQGILYSIDWSEHNLEICGEAMNGEQGYEMAVSKQPDIIITDIRMPVMDGLQLAEKIKKVYPHMEIIILSGYDDFSYAKEAIHIGVHEYLLKPIDAEEFLKCVCRLRDSIESKRKMNQLHQEKENVIKENKKEIQANLLNKIIQPTITKKEEQIRNNLSTLGVVFDKPIYKVLLLTIEDFLFLTKGRLEEEKLEILQRINDIIENTFFHGVHIESFINKYGQFVIIMNGESISKLYLEDCCQKITNKVLEEGFQCIFSCGTEKNAFSQVYISYQEAVSALHQHICQKGQNIIYFNGNIIEDNWMFEEVKQEEQLILEYMQSYDEEGMVQCMDRIFQKAVIEKQTFKSIQATCTKLIALLIAQLEEMLVLKEEVLFLFIEIERKIQQTFSAKYLETSMKEFVHELSDVLKNTKNDKYNSFVSEAMDYVENNYKSKVSVKDIATKLSITPNYFSQIFKAQKGMNFTDFLNEFRVKKAKQLLKYNDLKVYEISELVGYQNYKYFNKIFKKYTGMSPKEYQTLSVKR